MKNGEGNRTPRVIGGEVMEGRNGETKPVPRKEKNQKTSGALKLGEGGGGGWSAGEMAEELYSTSKEGKKAGEMPPVHLAGVGNLKPKGERSQVIDETNVGKNALLINPDHSKRGGCKKREKTFSTFKGKATARKGKEKKKRPRLRGKG